MGHVFEDHDSLFIVFIEGLLGTISVDAPSASSTHDKIRVHEKPAPGEE